MHQYKDGYEGKQLSARLATGVFFGFIASFFPFFIIIFFSFPSVTLEKYK